MRNSFLAAALELRSGIPAGAAPKSTGPDMVRALSTLQFLDFLGNRLDSNAIGDAAFVMNLITPDNGESFVVEVSNGTMTSLQGFAADSPDLTLTINRSDLENAMIGVVPLQQQVAEGTAVLDGDASIMPTLAGALTQFEPNFAIMPGTETGGASPAGDPFAQPDLGDSSGGLPRGTSRATGGPERHGPLISLPLLETAGSVQADKSKQHGPPLSMVQLGDADLDAPLTRHRVGSRIHPAHPFPARHGRDVVPPLLHFRGGGVESCCQVGRHLGLRPLADRLDGDRDGTSGREASGLLELRGDPDPVASESVGFHDRPELVAVDGAVNGHLPPGR